MFKFKIGQAVRTKNGKRIGNVVARHQNQYRDRLYDVTFGDEVTYTFLESSLYPADGRFAPDARLSQPAADTSSLGLSQGSADETTDTTPADDNPPVHFKFRFGDRVVATVPLIDFYDRKFVETDDTVRVVRARVQTEDGALLYGLSQDGCAVEKPLYAGEEGLILAPEPAPEPEPAPATITATERATGNQVELLSSVPVHYGRHVDARGQLLVVIDGIVIGTCEEVADDARAAFSFPHSTA